MFATIARDVRQCGSGWDLFDPEEPEDELDTACAFRDHFDEVELTELNMMRLSSCVMALTVPDYFVDQIQSLLCDFHICCPKHHELALLLTWLSCMFACLDMYLITSY